MNDLSQAFGGDEETNKLYEEVVRFVIQKRTTSVSDIQRTFKIGYSRACSFIEKMKEMGVIDSEYTNGSYTVLISSETELLNKMQKSFIQKLCDLFFKLIGKTK